MTDAPAPHPALPWLQRGLLLAGQAALLLPFAIVVDCGTKEQRPVTGLQVYGESAGLTGFGIAQALAALLLALLAWRGGADAARAAAGLGLRASLAAAGTATALLAPAFAFLFDQVQPRVGWVLHAGAWAALALAWLLGAARAALGLRGQPLAVAERVAIGLVLGVPLLIGLLALLLRDKSDGAAAGLLGALAGTPLVLAALGVGTLAATGQPDRRRWRLLLWAAVIAWVGGWLAALR